MKKVVSEAVINASTRIAVSVATVIENKTELTNKITIDCDPKTYPETSTACEDCFKSLESAQARKYRALRASWDTNRASVPFTYMEEDAALITEMRACRLVCRACVLDNFSQINNSVFSFEGVSNNVIINTIEQNLAFELDQDLTLKSGVLNSIAKVLGASSKAQVINYISTSLRQNEVFDSLSKVINSVKGSNEVTVTAGGNNYSGFTQSTFKRDFFSSELETNVQNSILSDQQWELAQRLYEDNRTLGKLAEITADGVANISDSLSSIIYEISLYIAIAAGVLAGAVMLYFVYRYYFVTDKSGNNNINSSTMNSSNNMVYPETAY